MAWNFDKVRLIDKAAAMTEFKQQSGFGEALAFLDQNPLPDVLLVTPKINQPAAAEALMQKLQKERFVDLAKLDISWQIQVGTMLIPTLIYGFLFLKLKFPVTERVAAGVSTGKAEVFSGKC